MSRRIAADDPWRCINCKTPAADDQETCRKCGDRLIATRNGGGAVKLNPAVPDPRQQTHGG